MQIDPNEKRNGIDWWIKRGVAPEMIDHDPKEPKIDRKPESFWVLFVIVVLLWAWYLWFVPFDGRSLLIGGVTGGAFILWASLKFRHLW